METQLLDAPEITQPPSSHLMGQYLTIRCAGETLAINISDVNELIEMVQITHIPMAPDYIRGVINLRGKVVPVIDLPARLAQQPSQLTKKSSMVLVEVHGPDSQQLLGMLVDEVDEILEIEAQHIQPAPRLGQNIRTDFIHAMGNVNGEFIILLAINQLLSEGELEQLSELSSHKITTFNDTGE